MRIEDLIADLASRATPVTPLAPPPVRLLGWTAVAAACAALGVAVFGVRPGIGDLIGEPAFAATAALAALTAILAALTSLVLAIPGAERTPAGRVSTFTLLAAWGLVVAAAVVRAGQGLSGASDWPICFVRVIAIGVIPAWMLFGMLRRAAPLRRGYTSGLAAIGAMAIAAGAIQFICPVGEASHAFLGHFGPVVAVGAWAAWAAPSLLRQRNSGMS